MNRPRDDGSVMLLTIGLVSLAALLIVVVIDVSALFLGRRDALAAADGAALAAAQAVDESALYRQGVSDTLPLDPQRVRQRVDAYLRDVARSSHLRDLQWRVSTDGTVVRVAIVGQLQLPVVNGITAGTGGRVTVTASAAAQTVVVR